MGQDVSYGRIESRRPRVGSVSERVSLRTGASPPNGSQANGEVLLPSRHYLGASSMVWVEGALFRPNPFPFLEHNAIQRFVPTNCGPVSDQPSAAGAGATIPMFVKLVVFAAAAVAGVGSVPRLPPATGRVRAVANA